MGMQRCKAAQHPFAAYDGHHLQGGQELQLHRREARCREARCYFFPVRDNARIDAPLAHESIPVAAFDDPNVDNDATALGECLW